MVMIHDLVVAGDEHAHTRLYIAPDNVFAWDGKFREPGLVENIAQTAAIQVGFICAQRNVPVPIGYIAVVKDLEIIALPDTDSTIETEIKVVNKVLDVTVVEGKVTQHGNLLCRCEMRIFAKTGL
jgi:predicted hotdog family 3-hydroxylacyl-ACP dehydratase